MSNKLIYCLCFAILGVLIAGHVLNFSAIILFSLVIICAAILICDTYTSTCILFFFFPFSYILAYNQYNICVFLAVAYILKSALKGKLFKHYFYTIFLMVYCFVFSDPSVDIKLGTLISPILLALVIFVCEETKGQNYSFFFNFFINAFIIATFIGFFKDEIPSISKLFEVNALYIEGVEESMDINRFCGLSYDPNFFTVIDCLLISIILFCNSKLMLKDILKLLFLIVVGFFTFSKSYFVILVFIGAVYILKNSKHITRNTALIVVLFVTIVITQSVFEVDFISLITNRFTTAEDASDLTTGRLDLWYEYLLYIFRQPLVLLFGDGFNALGLSKAVHNTFFEFLFRFGLIGSMLWGIYFIMCYCVIKNRNLVHKNNSLIPILVACLGFMFLSAFHFQQLWCCISLALFAIYKPVEEETYV